mmetsp:Transcript_104354/g.294212  ORF Transcript_104354/g.294212 Transcript_104354/m.294212 type:complete len:83 (-) Transcript_104354:249-497(-)
MEIRQWYHEQGICIPSSNVYMFGDRTENMAPFDDMGFNAKEISCLSRDDARDGIVGYCGATPEEVVETKGISMCTRRRRRGM